MSIRFMSAVFEHNMPDLVIEKGGELRTIKASTAKLILLALADHANDEGKSSYPSFTKLGKKTAIRSRQTLSDAIDALEGEGYISKGELSELGTTTYTLYMGVLVGTTTVPAKDSGTTTVKPAVQPVKKTGTTTVLKSSFKPSKDNHPLKDSGKAAPPEPEYEPVDSEGNPLPPKKPTKRQRDSVPEKIYKPVALAIGEVLGWDMKIGSNWSTVGRAARELALAGYTPETIKATFAKGGPWWKEWPGNTGQPPKLNQITKEIGRLSGKTSTNGHVKYDAEAMRKAAKKAIEEADRG